MRTAAAPSDTATARWVLFATISASSMAFIGGSALNVALPAIQSDLGASGADLLWIVNAFALLLAALILVGGSLGDHFGRKRVYLIGIIVFTVSSFVCGIAPTTSILIVARAVQGIGGALMVPGSLAIISAYFGEEKRGEAIGTWASFTTLTSVLGPVLGGILAENGLWRGVFFINIPLGIAATYALVTRVPESKDDEAPKELDFLGAFLVTLGMAGITYGFIELGREPGEPVEPFVIGALIVGVLGLSAFVLQEARSAHPMMSLKLFRSRTFSGANLLTLFLYGALGGALFFIPLNLVQVQGYGETRAGFALLPFSILLVLMSRWAGGLVDKYGPRPPLTVGPLIVGFAFFALALPGITSGPDAYWTTFFPGFLLIGIGMGITVAPLTTTVMGSVPQHNAGVASGINNAVSRSSQVFATAIMGGLALVIFGAALGASLDDITLPDEARATLDENAADLGAMAIPDQLDAETTATVREAINASFVEMFRIMMIAGAVLSWLSAGLAYVTIEPKLSEVRAQLRQELADSESDDDDVDCQHVPCLDQQLSAVTNDPRPSGAD
ncbi:MAG: MFS transporter [Anaerolineales bacterium]